MPRKLRLEFPGAIYHVINRGNYRTWIFADAATRSAFESCLFEVCERSQWLESTFANRINRFRREHGHQCPEPLEEPAG